jgi:phosphopantetheine--protein transferase-like protein
MKKKNKGPTIGVDIARIARFKDQKALAKKILSPKEMEIYSTHPQPATYLAGRFAGKEAFIKAYRQPPLPELSSIEVLHRTDGSPYIQFQDNTYEVSISHDGEYVIAMVII